MSGRCGTAGSDRIAREHHINYYDPDAMTDVCACGTAVVAELEYAEHISEVTEQAVREQIARDIRAGTESPPRHVLSNAGVAAWKVGMARAARIARGGTDD